MKEVLLAVLIALPTMVIGHLLWYVISFQTELGWHRKSGFNTDGSEFPIYHADPVIHMFVSLVIIVGSAIIGVLIANKIIRNR